MIQDNLSFRRVGPSGYANTWQPNYGLKRMVFQLHRREICERVLQVLDPTEITEVGEG